MLQREATVADYAVVLEEHGADAGVVAADDSVLEIGADRVETGMVHARGQPGNEQSNTLIGAYDVVLQCPAPEVDAVAIVLYDPVAYE
jgi:hypothetical protein